MLKSDQDFSQYGEQNIILDFFNKTVKPYSRFCVDAGAFDGFVGSNSRALYLSGWSGLAIEPNPRSFERLSHYYADRPDIICVQAALSDHARSQVPMEFSIGPAGTSNDIQWQYGQVSTLHRDFAASYERDHGYIYETRLVEIENLTTLMRMHGVPQDLGFISIDCEGEDVKILKSIDFNEYKPLLICVESLDSNRHVFSDVIAPYGYSFIAKTDSNSFFERRCG